jgi:hypothetical protein
VASVLDPEWSGYARWSDLPFLDRETARFELAGVPPGRYRVGASSTKSGAPLNAVAEVEVRSGESTYVQLALTPDPVLHGRVRTDDGSPLQPLIPGETRYISLNGDLQVQIPDNGLFQATLSKLASYRLHVELPRTWHVASATQGPRDVLAQGIQVASEGGDLEPLDVVISRSTGTIEVSVAPKEGVHECGVLLLHRIGDRVENVAYLAPPISVIGVPSTYAWPHIPPGTYWMFALPGRELPGRVPFLEMDFLNQHKELIQEVQVRAGSTSRTQLTVLDLH